MKIFSSFKKSVFPESWTTKSSAKTELTLSLSRLFFLESFIGNSLKYGQDEQEKIMIRIQAVQVEPFVIRISVQDQGEGFSPEILEAIEEYHKTHVKNELLGTGIYNRIERLNLIYQDRARFAAIMHFPTAQLWKSPFT